jgi:tetratricopeptide (TPR) repeat protein
MISAAQIPREVSSVPLTRQTILALLLCAGSVTPLAAQPRTRAKSAQPPAESKSPADQAAEQATKLFEAGQDAHQAGKFEEAVRLYGEALAKDSTLWQAEFQRASAYLSLNKTDDARASVKRTLELLGQFAASPELGKITARAHLLGGEIELAANKLTEAEAAFRRALAAQPPAGNEAAQAHAGLAQVMLENGKPAEAITEAKAAIAAGDSRALVYSVLGEAQFRGKLYDDALVSFGEALKREPENAVVLRFRAETHVARNDLPNAAKDFRASLAAEKSTPTAFRLASLLRVAKQYDEAAELYQQVIAAEPENGEARAALASLMIESGKSADAVAELESLVKADPGRAALRANLAELYLPKQPDKALEQYAEAAKLEPQNAQYQVGVASALVKLRRFDEAVTLLRPLLTQPLRGDLAYAAHANLATALFEKDDYANAAREYIWLLDRQTDQQRAAVTLYFLGICLDRLGDFEQALKAYTEFLKLAGPGQQLEIDKVKLRLPPLRRQIEKGQGKKK